MRKVRLEMPGGKVEIIVTKRHYAYALRYPDMYRDVNGIDLSNVVFYVGKGTGKRALVHLGDARSGNLTPTSKVIQQVWKTGKQIVIDILFESDNEDEVSLCERTNIKQYAGPHLVNFKYNRGDQSYLRRHTLSTVSQEQLLEIASKWNLDLEVTLSRIIDQLYQSLYNQHQALPVVLEHSGN